MKRRETDLRRFNEPATTKPTMKTYYIIAASVFLLAYAVFHFGFRQNGDGQLYKINARIAFEMHTPNENFNGVTIRSYRKTNIFVKFICGACEYDGTGTVEMVNVEYRRGDFVYTNFPQHEIIKTGIINTRTGESVEVNVPDDFKYGDDFSKLAEYKQRNLTAGEQFKLDQNYIKANFQPLSTFTNRCLYANLIFAVAALFLAYPKLVLYLLEAIFTSQNPHDPANYLRGGG